jgi:hypothetical protein
MEGMVSEGSILSQSDVDALLAQAEAPEEDNTQGIVEEPEKIVVHSSKGKSEDEIRGLLSQLQKRAFVRRDRGVSVIWNASGVFPMTEGYTLEIQGRRYISLGSLFDSHLVVGFQGES